MLLVWKTRLIPFPFPIACLFSKKICHRDHERPKPVERERERERRKKVDRLVSMVGARVTNTGWKRWRRTMAEGAGTEESRMHRARTRPATPLPPTRAGLRFQHVQYRNRVVNSEDRIPRTRPSFVLLRIFFLFLFLVEANTRSYVTKDRYLKYYFSQKRITKTKLFSYLSTFTIWFDRSTFAR